MDDKERPKLAAPKFSSFKPKKPAPALSDAPESSREASRNQREDIVRHHRRPHKDSRKRDYIREHKRYHDDDLSLRPGEKRDETEGRHAPLAKDETPSFIVDKKGDDGNIQYGSIHRYSIPAYRRTGYGNVVGLSLRQKIDRDLSNDKRLIIPTSNTADLSTRNRLNLGRVSLSREVRIKPGLLERAADQEVDFLPFRTSGKESKNEDNHGYNDSESTADDNDDTHYRSIQGKAKMQDRPVDDDVEFNHIQEDGGEAESIWSRETRSLRVGVDNDPSDGQSWLKMIEHQQTQFTYRKTGLSEAEKHSLADLRLSLAEKALRHVKDDHFRELLLRVLMDQAVVLWDAVRTQKRWKEILSQDPTYLSLWTDYINFLQTNFTTFQFEDLRAAFGEALRMVHKANASDNDTRSRLARIKCYLLLRATTCMRESGFSELAISVWQANLEYNFHGPDTSTGRSSSEFKALFEEYWDSEVPRIGEENSVSWSVYSKTGGVVPDSSVDVTLPTTDFTVDRWLEMERCVEQNRHLARTLDNTMEDDPYRVVLFSDIESFMVELHSSQLKDFMLQAFLDFCQLPQPQSIHTATSWLWDPFLRNHGIETWGDNSIDLSTAMCCFPLNLWAMFAKLGSRSSVFQGDIPESKTFVRRALLSLVNSGHGGDILAEYYLAFEATHFPDIVRKTAKRLIKQRSSSLRLYNAYSQIEYRLNNISAAENVLATSINMFVGNPETVVLWETWIWELLEDQDPTTALLRLLTMAEADIKAQPIVPAPGFSRTSSTGAIRVRRLLVTSRDQYLSTKSYDLAVNYSTLIILMSYLTSFDPLSGALEAFSESLVLFSSNLPPYSIHHEILHQALARLIQYHISHFPSYSPKVIRSALHESVGLFPQNSLLFSLFASLESKFRIDDRVRSAVSSTLHEPKASSTEESGNPQANETILTHMFAIQTELNRPPESGSNQHSIRAVFERAVQSECGRKSALLWKVFVHWESKQTGGQGARAIWWRAVRACPWVKALWVLPWEIPGMVGRQELKGIWDTIRDKEIRVRVILED